MSEELKSLGALLRDAREKSGLSMAAAAKRALISAGYVHAIEHGRKLPTLRVLAQLAATVGADPVLSLEMHKAAKAANNEAYGRRLLARAGAGDRKARETLHRSIMATLEEIGTDRLKVAISSLPENYSNSDLAAAIENALKEVRVK